MSRFRSPSIAKDVSAGAVLGTESVPDSLTSGLIADVNPAFGLYGSIFGLLGAVFTSAEFMAIQPTGAMAAVIRDVDAVHTAKDPNAALFTLTILVGIIMIVAGLRKLGSLLRFVSHAVLVGFVAGVGINIVLGQLGDFTGYDAEGESRLAKVLNLVLHIADVQFPAVATGIVAVVMILLLQRTPIAPVALVIPVLVLSAAVELFDLDVVTLDQVARVPAGLPMPRLPDLGMVPSLILPAASLAFVGLVQGAAISANNPNADGESPDASKDFVGQGAGNVAAGFFQGMPVAGSMSATAVNISSGAASRVALLTASGVMAVITLLLARFVNYAAMPALAGLLIVAGVQTIKPKEIEAVLRTGRVQQATMITTFVLTLLMPLQYSVLVGVGASVVLTVVRQSQDLVVRRLILDGDSITECDIPATLGSRDVVALQPYGSLFFATADALEDGLPEITADTHRSVVILRLRGTSDLGTTLSGTLTRYVTRLHASGSKLMVTTDSDRVVRQLRVVGFEDLIGVDNLYTSDNRVGRATRAAYDDAVAWVSATDDPGESGATDVESGDG